MDYAILGSVALAMVVMVGWSQWCLNSTTKTLTETFSRALTQANQELSAAMATLVLGYRDSAPSSEVSSTMPNETEPSERDVFNLDDMPDNIREAYLREAQEDAMMSRSWTPSSTEQPTSS